MFKISVNLVILPNTLCFSFYELDMPAKQTIQGFTWQRIPVYECSYVLVAMIIFNECSYVTCHFNGRNSFLWAKLLGHRVEVLVQELISSLPLSKYVPQNSSASNYEK